MTKNLSNDQLNPALIPDPEGDLHDWIEFAATINGYEVAGSFEACGDLANMGTASTLTELRCALSFEYRRDHHSGGWGFEEEPIRSLLRRIREKVEAGELD
ncbi:hypothetical protein EVJ50_03395 [Synechococcus sp. RSCCF101]|uniref:hypothetical protein n=1 Tax=Synechococcus sp. RSCCF101 TaxID=2511069 RepID=UPI0012465DCE|nr:hypothetical protein [Synechococcus sp. RSCCF101]QEY31437.1 hypothetical protein EVJ50_03395 [Synechococcus sp. RSCCF101]